MQERMCISFHERMSSHECQTQEIFGGNAVSDEYHIGRHVANLFVTQTYEVGAENRSPLAHLVLTGFRRVKATSIA